MILRRRKPPLNRNGEEGVEGEKGEERNKKEEKKKNKEEENIERNAHDKRKDVSGDAFSGRSSWCIVVK